MFNVTEVEGRLEVQLKVQLTVIRTYNKKKVVYQWKNSSDRMKVTNVLFHNLSWDYLACLCVCVCVCVSVPV